MDPAKMNAPQIFSSEAFFTKAAGDDLDRIEEFTADSIRSLAVLISADPAQRDAAIEILINIAARTDETGECAQRELLALYADPRPFEERDQQPPPPGMSDSMRRIRSDLRLAAHKMCEISLGREMKDGAHQELTSLSIAVAYMGGRAGSPPSGDPMDNKIAGFIHEQLERRQCDRMESDNVLKADRYTDGGELISAGKKFKALRMHPQALEMGMAHEEECADAGQDRWNAFSNSLNRICGDLDAGPKVVWLHTGAQSAYKHWMPLILIRDGDKVDCHIIDTNTTASRGRGVVAELQGMLSYCGEKFRLHRHEHDLQQHSPNACGVLGHGILEHIDQMMQDDRQGGAAERLGSFIDRGLVPRWNSLSPADQEANVLAERAKLLARWEATGLPVDAMV